MVAGAGAYGRRYKPIPHNPPPSLLGMWPLNIFS